MQLMSGLWNRGNPVRRGSPGTGILLLCTHRFAVSKIGCNEKKTIIFEAELVAYIAAVVLWESRLQRHALVAYVDNNSARDACMFTSLLVRTDCGSRRQLELIF